MLYGIGDKKDYNSFGWQERYRVAVGVAEALDYLHKGRERVRMHPKTLKELDYIRTMLRDDGEEQTFRYIKQNVLQGKPFPWEMEE